MDRADYEWAYFIGGNCALRFRKGGRSLARIEHSEQGVYEALLLRWQQWDQADPWSLGIYDSPEKAIEAVEQVLQPHWEIK